MAAGQDQQALANGPAQGAVSTLTGGLRLPAETSLSRVLDESGMTVEEHNRRFVEQLDHGNVGSADSFHEETDEECPPVNFREDIGLDDQALILMPTKELNRLLKKKGIGKERQKKIKAERRTLKNRGYAANCRVKREDEEKDLQDEIARDEAEIKKLESREIDLLHKLEQLRKKNRDMEYEEQLLNS